jgi:hypothetical protein
MFDVVSRNVIASLRWSCQTIIRRRLTGKGQRPSKLVRQGRAMVPRPGDTMQKHSFVSLFILSRCCHTKLFCVAAVLADYTVKGCW